jgi:hypothetical protein
MKHPFLAALAPDRADALSRQNSSGPRTFTNYANGDPKPGCKRMEAMARVLTERLQATRHKLRVFIERANEDDDARQVC